MSSEKVMAFEVRDPGVGLPVGGQRRVQRLLERARPGDLVDPLHALLVLDPLRLHRGDGLPAGGALLPVQHRARVLEGGLDDRDRVEGVQGVLRVEQIHGGERERGERRRQGEVLRKVEGEADVGLARVGAAPGRVPVLDDAGGAQGPVDLDRAPHERVAVGRGRMVVREQAVRGGHGVARPGQQGQQHGVRDLHLGDEPLGRRRDQPVVGLLGPVDEALRRLLADDALLLRLVVAGAGEQPGVLDLVVGGLGDDLAGGVEAGAAGPAGDLVELAGRQVPHALAVELGQRGEDDRANRHVDADAERVGAADDRQQARLGQALDETPVARQHPGVVDADALAQQSGQRGAEARPEAERADGLRDLVALLAARNLHGRQRLRAGDGVLLREVHDVRGRPVRGGELREQVLQRLHGPGVAERHGPLGVVDDRDLPSRPPREVVPQLGDVAEGGRHEEHLGTRHLQQRDLPRPAALRVGVVVELVHDDRGVAARPVRAFAQGEVREDLGRAADDRGVGVDRAVAGDHADVVRAEQRDQLEELLRHERLDRRGVEARASLGQRVREGPERHEGLS
jgi:hypothetical protein